MFYIDKNEELTSALLYKLIDRFNTYELPKLRKWENYYKGKHDILAKRHENPEKKYNYVVTNYCKIISDTYKGYICGKPITYTSNNDIDDIQSCINYNDDNAENVQWLGNALNYGIAYELQWLDEFVQPRYSQVSPLNGFVVRDNTLEKKILYFVRWYDLENYNDSTKMCVEVYSATDVKKYICDGLGGALTPMGEEKHYFMDVPVSVFDLNENNENIFNSIIPLNDAYNELQSAEIDDYTAWVDAYLQLVGVDADKDDIKEMKQNRVIILPEGAQAGWLTKNASDTQIVNMLENIKKNIFKVSACPDMADETFLAQSGTALAYKLVGFENVASGIVAQFTKAIQRRIELICNILNLKAADAVWRDIKINFVRNLPNNLTEIVQLINSLKGTVSDKTLLSQVPFITDVDAELEAVQAQKKANMDMFGFTLHSESTEPAAGSGDD